MGMIGRVVGGRYEIIEELGRGGFAIVYRGRDTKLFDAPVAVKYLRPECSEREDALKMLRDEVQLSARLRHANIRQVKDDILEGEDHFVVFEFVDGVQLKDLIMRAREKPDRQLGIEHGMRMPAYLAAHVIREMSNALYYAHTLEDTDRRTPLNIVHRDISPQNIMISYTGEVKLTDFGIAKALICSGEQTQTGAIKGKPSYMSPEQAMAKPMDQTSDLYSLGIVFYEALAGEKLYQAESDLETAKLAARGGIDKEKLEALSVPDALRRVLIRAVQPDRNRRYQNGAEMARDLSGFLAPYHDITRDLAQYMNTMFRREVAGANEKTEQLDAAGGVPGRSTAGGALSEPAAPVTEGERTIIDLIKVTAYSGRRFFLIGGAVAAGLVLALLALDAFVFMRTRPGVAIHYLFFPPSAVIVTTPPGAVVTLDGKRLSEPTPTRLTGLKPNHPYDVKIALDGYEPIPTEYTYLPRPNGNAAETLPYRFKVPVSISSNLSGARISLNGAALDTTPNDLKLEVSDTPLTLSLSYPGFEPLSGSFVATSDQAGGSRFLQFERTRNSQGLWQWQVVGKFFGYREFTVSPKTASLQVDGEDRSFDGNGKVLLQLAYGSHSVRISKPPFLPELISFDVTSGETVYNKKIELKRFVTVRARSRNSEEEIDRATVTVLGMTRSSGDVFKLPVGSYTATASANGYEDRRRTISVSDGGETDFWIDLDPGTATVVIKLLMEGKPASGARVEAVGRDGQPVDLDWTDSEGKLRVTTDKLSGKCEFKAYVGSDIFKETFDISRENPGPFKWELQ
jgi:serine/threonine-protein kinase